MSKMEKILGVPKASDRKRVDSTKPARKGRPHKKQYPAHWMVYGNRAYGGNVLRYRIMSQKAGLWFEFYRADRDDRPDITNLEELLAWFAERHPETATYPVRFIDCAAIECGREVISN